MLRYNNSHETIRKPEATGEATPTSTPVAGARHDLVGGGLTSGFLCNFRFPTATDLSEGSKEGAELQGFSGPSLQTFGAEEETISEPFVERFLGFWLQYRPLDHETSGRGNLRGFWNLLSS